MVKDHSIPVPPAVKIQLSKLLGINSKGATQDAKTVTEWKHTLKKVLDELYKYIEENVDTDGLHTLMLYSCLYAAHESLKEDNFWPGYVEGITRLSLLLMGDYPDHRRRKGGRKKKDHYNLNRMRSVNYTQNTNQKFQTMFAASRSGFLHQNSSDALRKFRQERGFSASHKEFITWFKERYPEDYAKLF